MNIIKFHVTVFCIILCASCASHDTKTVHLNKPDYYAHQASGSNFSVGAEIFDTDAKTKAAFDQKLVRKGIYPVQIALENKSDQTLMVVRDQIELESNVSNSIRPMSAAEVAEEVEANAMAHAIFGFGIFSYAAAKDANEEREADYANKQIPEEWIVRPGRTSGGFVFFRLGNGEKPDGRKLMIPVENMADPGNTAIAIVPF